MKKNCWEIKKCGKRKAGNNYDDGEICPVTQSGEFDGKNNGLFAGRICWRETGTHCDGNVQGSYVFKALNCSKCEVYLQIRREEGKDFQL